MSGTTKLMTAGGGGVNITTASSVSSDVTVQVPSVNGTLVSTGSTAQVSQAMLASGVAGNGPAFSASSGSTLSAGGGAATKIQINTETFDTNSNFDISTYRFTPTVSGYYQINCIVRTNNGGAGEFVSMIYKNGSSIYIGTNAAVNSASINISQVSGLVYLNGSTDYVELYVYTTTTCTIAAGACFNGSMTRAA